ncbi:MAG: GNAT family N-acetyltransferase [Thermodesulfobacteriota bacterium]
MALYFEPVALGEIDDGQLAEYPDRTIYQTVPWLTFVSRTQNAEPLLAALKQSGETIGYFTGLIVTRFGFRILGSPFPGWSSTYMGFNLHPGVSRSRALSALTEFAFDGLNCHHLELMDRYLTPADYSEDEFETWWFESYEIDLEPTEDKLFKNMRHQTRGCVRKAERSGVVIEEANDPEFVEEYYAQLKHVFATKDRVPHFGIHRVRELVNCLLPTGGLLLLRARNEDGVCVSTGIFPFTDRVMYAWGQASWRQYSNVRPNEALFWYGISYAKRRGLRVFDMVGGGDYKKKYGGTHIRIPWVRRSKSRRIAFLRAKAETVLLSRQKALGKLVRFAQRFSGGSSP